MDKEKNSDQMDEDKEKVQKIAKEIIEPALQKALSDATKEGSPQEVVSALANCYGGLLVDLMGRKAAAAFMQGHAIHLTSIEETPLSN